MSCPETNTAEVDQSSFWSSNGIHWDAHRIGWTVAGATAAATVLISFTQIFFHLRHYTVPRQQRQIVRILLMPPVYAVVSFLSYRFYRAYYYYEVGETVWEAIAIASFMFLVLEYIGSSTEEQRATLAQKDKQKLPLPLCFLRYRPSKPYFLFVLKWSVLQYSIIRPLISIASIITEAYNVLCPSTYSVHFAEVYLEAVDFVCVSIALYGLITIYVLVRHNLQGRRPLSKFLWIKAIVFLTFFQGFIFSLLAKHGAIHATAYWTTTNIANGLQALTTCCEMVIFSSLGWWIFPHQDYKHLHRDGQRATNPFKSLLHAFDFRDFAREFWLALVFFVNFIRRKPGTHSSNSAFDLGDAFEGKSHRPDGEKLGYDMGKVNHNGYSSKNGYGQNGYANGYSQHAPGTYAQPSAVEAGQGSYAYRPQRNTSVQPSNGQPLMAYAQPTLPDTARAY